MDHNEAKRMQAHEKYVLGELPETLREEFEAHFFDCADCADEVKAVSSFVDNAREVLRQEGRRETGVKRVAVAGGWFAWLKPIVAVPLFAVLLLGLGYQNLVTIPYWKKEANKATSPRVLSMYSLIKANTRGDDSLKIAGRAGEPLGLYVDVPAAPTYTRYLLRLEDPDGKTKILRTVSFSEAQRTVVVEMTPGNRSGAYQIVVLGLAEQTTDPAGAVALATLKFQVEILK